MKSKVLSRLKKHKILIKRCHLCGHISESESEVQKCPSCHKSFLPLNYFSKVHGQTKLDYDQMFNSSEELCDEDLIKGIHVLW